jgi:hypothetical protein
MAAELKNCITEEHLLLTEIFTSFMSNDEADAKELANKLNEQALIRLRQGATSIAILAENVFFEKRRSARAAKQQEADRD